MNAIAKKLITLPRLSSSTTVCRTVLLVAIEAIMPNPAGFSPLHAVWVQMNAAGEPGDLFYSTSTDGGATWAMPVTTSGYTTPARSEKAMNTTMAVGSWRRITRLRRPRG